MIMHSCSPKPPSHINTPTAPQDIPKMNGDVREMMRKAARDKEKKAEALAAALKNSKSKEQVSFEFPSSHIPIEVPTTISSFPHKPGYSC